MKLSNGSFMFVRYYYYIVFTFLTTISFSQNPSFPLKWKVLPPLIKQYHTEEGIDIEITGARQCVSDQSAFWYAVGNRSVDDYGSFIFRLKKEGAAEWEKFDVGITANKISVDVQGNLWILQQYNWEGDQPKTNLYYFNINRKQLVKVAQPVFLIYDLDFSDFDNHLVSNVFYGGAGFITSYNSDVYLYYYDKRQMPENGNWIRMEGITGTLVNSYMQSFDGQAIVSLYNLAADEFCNWYYDKGGWNKVGNASPYPEDCINGLGMKHGYWWYGIPFVKTYNTDELCYIPHYKGQFNKNCHWENIKTGVCSVHHATNGDVVVAFTDGRIEWTSVKPQQYYQYDPYYKSSFIVQKVQYE